MSSHKHIATGALYGISGRRIGTAYLHSEEQIAEFVERMQRLRYPAHIRRRVAKAQPANTTFPSAAEDTNNV